MNSQTITALEVQKRNRKRVNVYLDGEYAFSLTLDQAARLHKGQTLTAEDVEALRGDDEVVRAVDSAARFIAMRPRSEHEVRRNLLDKDVPEPVVDSAIERLHGLGYLDDRAFAAFWVSDRNTFRPSSPRAMRYELRQKGVADAIIAEVLADIDSDDAAYRAARDQARRLRGKTKQEVRVKLSGVLQRRGFSFREARDAIERLIEDMEHETPGAFADDADDDTGPEGQE